MCFGKLKSKISKRGISNSHQYRKSYTIMKSIAAHEIADIITNSRDIIIDKLIVCYNPTGNYYKLVVFTSSKESLDKIAQEVNNYNAKRN